MSSGWQVLGGAGQHHAAVFVFEKPVDLDTDFALKMQFERHFACPLGNFRISVTTDDHAGAVAASRGGRSTALRRPPAALTAAERGVLLRRLS